VADAGGAPGQSFLAVRADEGRDHGGRTGDADRVSTLARADRTPIPNTL
jgi:hypothetical protein